jgi:valine dehydrogenase (NAD+)
VSTPPARPTGSDHLAVFDLLDGHEQVVVCHDEASGLRAIIAIHSTALGPALGGTRFHVYPDDRAALVDALHLARGMTYKAAVTGLDLGGGKAVIVGDPREIKTEALLRAYGRFVESLGGRYITACTVSEDMDVVARESRHVTGRTVEHGGAGDSSVLTAYGVLQGMRAAAEHVWGSAALQGRTVGVAGVGKVGRHLVQHLVEEGADVVVSDVDPLAVQHVVDRHGVRSAPSTQALVAGELDVYAPCALGGALDDQVVGALRARVVCGAANNQLAHAGIDKVLRDKGVVYAPDFVVNAGGLVQVADELEGFSFERARRRVEGIRDTTARILHTAELDGVTPAAAADMLAERRIAAVSRLGTIRLPHGG